MERGLNSWTRPCFSRESSSPHRVVSNSSQIVSKPVANTRPKQPIVYFRGAVIHILKQRLEIQTFHAAFIFAFLLLACPGLLTAQNQTDPYVVKEYPDGTKVKLRWSQVSSRPDSGIGRGGIPSIRAMAPGDESLPEEEAPTPANAPAKVPPPPAGSPNVKVIKIYPDGTQLIVPWSDLGKSLDQGEKHGGPPKIVPYDPRGAGASAPSPPFPGGDWVQP